MHITDDERLKIKKLPQWAQRVIGRQEQVITGLKDEVGHLKRELPPQANRAWLVANPYTQQVPIAWGQDDVRVRMYDRKHVDIDGVMDPEYVIDLSVRRNRLHLRGGLGHGLVVYPNASNTIEIGLV